MDALDLGTLAKRLRHARGHRAMTQQQLARASGVGQSDISKLERGEMLRTTGLIALARALRYSATWLDTGHGQGPLEGSGDLTEAAPRVVQIREIPTLIPSELAMQLWRRAQRHNLDRRDSVVGLMRELMRAGDESQAREIAGHIERLLEPPAAPEAAGLGNG